MDASASAPHVHTMEASEDAPSTVDKADNAMCSSYGMDFIIPLTSCFIVSEREAVVNLFCGHYYGTITSPGFYLRNWVCVEGRRISTAIQSLDIANVKTADANGNPLLVSGIVSWAVVDARRAALDVADPRRFVADQAPAVLKRVVSQYPYEAEAVQGEEDVPTLRTETEVVATRMRNLLQERVDVAGVRILSFQLNELSYAPEIAQAMLRRQQADALVAARAKVVSGAVGIARDAVASDALNGMSDAERARTVRDLLIVLVGDREAMPTVSVGG
ncbi:hypothetical protein MMPV_001563 [Pyropia vietnamensis]